MSGWPFWAATSDERIEAAFDLAGLRAGERLLDLGCGDGRVLLRAAALWGAVVTGVELDPGLAAGARRLLAEHGVEGTVVEADFATAAIEADVVFAYLSPATLQRLRGRLASCTPGTRVVTTGYAVPGWEADAVSDRCFLYRLPASDSPVVRVRRGWASPGVLVAMRPGAPSLVAVKLHHGGGPVVVRAVGRELEEVVALRAGADDAAAGDEVVVDLRFEPAAAGAAAAGVLHSAGSSEEKLQVFAVFDPGDPGIWALSEPGCGALAGAFDVRREDPGRLHRLLGDARAAGPG